MRLLAPTVIASVLSGLFVVGPALAGEPVAVTFELPRPAVTGEPFTIRPIYPDGVTLETAETQCQWELEWGDTAALRDRKRNDTYGSTWMWGPMSQGFCDEWTFSLPYTAGLIYRYRFLLMDQTGFLFDSGKLNTSPEEYNEAPRFTGTVGSTVPGFTASNIPLAWLSRDDATLVVGQPTTFRLHTIDFTPAPWYSRWYAMDWDEDGGCCRESIISYDDGDAFTFTPTIPGHYVVHWDGLNPMDPCTELACSWAVGASLDPIAKAADTTPPTVTAPRRGLLAGTAINAGRVTLRVPWTGSDVGTGIARYEFSQRTDGGPWTTVSTALTKPTIDRSLAPQHDYRFRVRAVDKAGNVGAWAYGSTFRLSRYSEFSSAITYRGRWTTVSSPVYWGGGARKSRMAGATASLTFTGRSIAWVARTGPDRGKAGIYVNGTRVATVDLYSPDYQQQRVVWARSWTTSVSREVTIRVAGTSGRPRVDLDALVKAN